MKYVTESLAQALYEARKRKANEEDTFVDYDDVDSQGDDGSLEDIDDFLDDDEDDIGEARWVTMKNKNHALIDDDGSVLAGGDPKTRKKVSKKELKAKAAEATKKAKSESR